MKYRNHDQVAKDKRQAISSIAEDYRAEERSRRAKARLKGKKSWKING